MPTRTDTLCRAALMAFGVVAFTHIRHLGMTEPGHAMLDGALALPLALVCVWVGRRSPSRTAGAVVASVLFALMLVPAADIHGFVDETVAGAHAHLSAAANAPGLSHHVTDAAVAFPLALLLAALGARRHRPPLRAPCPATSRRRLAFGAAVAVFGTALPLPQAFAALPTPFTVEMPIPPVITDANITLTAAETEVQVMPVTHSPPTKTKMWTYKDSSMFAGTFPGPTIRRPSGSTTTVTVVNSMPNDLDRFAAPTELTLHHHGNHSASSEDGQPHSELIPLGGQRPYTYEFMEGGAPERAAFQWYHDHRMDATARNVWMGLAGMVILDPAPGDPEAALKLPSGDFDVPIMIADRKFDANNQIPYTFDPNGVPGTIFLANGAPQPFLKVEPRRYRIRLLNASNLRPVLLSLDNGMGMTQIATESGLLPAPLPLLPAVPVRLDPAERVELILDFTGKDGQSFILKNGLGFGPNLSQVMQFRVELPLNGTDTSALPGALATPDYGNALLPASDDEVTIPRVWLLTQLGVEAPHWTINGRAYDPARVDAKPVLGTVEKWVFVNTTSVEHVMHIHDVDWCVVTQQDLLADPGGKVCRKGLKESFLVRPFEVVEVAARFTDHLGVYVFHCHVLEHEDFSMMAQFKVVEPGLKNQLPA